MSAAGEGAVALALADGGQPYQKKSTGSVAAPVGTLAEAGISKKLSARVGNRGVRRAFLPSEKAIGAGA